MVDHHFSVDVEEYFHPSALENLLPKSEWDGLPRRAPAQMSWILEHLEAERIKGTFFILGWLAKREAAMVRAISEAGHEIASHGWEHRRVTTLSPEEFRADLRKSREILGDLSGQPVTGFRAPSFSILPGFEWSLDVLLEEGFEYDSSMFPVRIHPNYGYPSALRDPHLIERPSGCIVEIPPATLRVGKMNLPAAGGAYLRFFPVALLSRALAEAESRGVPGTLYFHPWEIDRKLPSLPGPWLTQLRMRGRTWSVKKRISKLTRRFRFRRMQETAKELLAPERAPSS